MARSSGGLFYHCAMQWETIPFCLLQILLRGSYEKLCLFHRHCTEIILYPWSLQFPLNTNKILISIQENSWIIISVSVKVNVLNLTYTLCRVFSLSMGFRTFVLIMRLIFSSTMDVYETPGKFGSYLSMTRHPGPTDFNELAVCLRFERFIIMCIIRQRI